MNFREIREAVDGGKLEDKAAMLAAAETFRESAERMRRLAATVEAVAEELVGPGGDIGERLIGAQLQATLALRGMTGGEATLEAGLDVLLVLLQRGNAF